jgi:hypothetical protein
MTVVSGLSQPALLDIDMAGGKIYWTDQGTDNIRRANLNGSNQETLVTNQNNPKPLKGARYGHHDQDQRYTTRQQAGS